MALTTTYTASPVLTGDDHVTLGSFVLPARYDPIGPMILGRWESTGELVLIGHVRANRRTVGIVRGILSTRAVPHVLYELFTYGLANDPEWDGIVSPPEPDPVITTNTVFFNVKDFGAIGDDSTNNNVALQAALDAATAAGGGTIYFPAGFYVVSGTFVVPAKTTLLGDHNFWSALRQVGAEVTLLNPTTFASGGIRNMQLQSIGHAIDISDTSSFSIQNCYLTSRNAGTWCVYSNGNLFSALLINVSCTGTNYLTNGVMLAGQTTAISLDCNSCNEGVRMCSLNNTLEHYRAEVNKTAIRIGVDINGNNLACEESSIRDAQFESNNIALQSSLMNKCDIGPIYASGFSGAAPNGTNPVYVLDLQYATECSFHHIRATADCPNSTAIKLGYVDGCTFTHVSGSGGASGQSWSGLPPPIGDAFGGNTWEHCIVNGPPWNASDTVIGDVVTKSHRVLALQGLDLLNPATQGRNLRGIAQAVTQTATSVDIVFQVAAQDNGIFLGFFADSNEVGGALVAGTTYYYRISAVTSAGEALGPAETAHTIAGGDNATNLSVTGPAGSYKFRIYRGTAAGVYGGYYETAVGATTYQDVGAAFTANGAAPPYPNSWNNGRVEPDANYAVIATPNWGTTTWVTAKATTGFTINFGTAAPASAEVDWFIVR